MMSWWRPKTNRRQGESGTGSENRRDPRIGSQFKVRYSGSHNKRIVIGYGTVTDLSRYGFGIEGNRGVTRGMELALFLEVPDIKEPLCIPQATVSWISGSRFGVELRAAQGKDSDWLERLSWSEA